MALKVAIASDQGGFELKKKIIDLFVERRIDFKDFGSYTKASVDYPDYAFLVGEKVANKEFDRGILICGTGVGISIAANKVKGIRCALVHDVFTAKATRQHNDSNVLAMGGRVIGDEHALMIVKTWLEEAFVGEHHQRRIDKIAEYEARKDQNQEAE